MQRLKEKLLALAPVYLMLCFSFFWLWLNRDIYFDPENTLPRDNLKHHLPMFVYVVEYLRSFGTFPDWLYSNQGGLWLAALANNFLVLMPHRLLGVYFASSGSFHPNLIYKLFLVLAQTVFLLGLYRLSRLLFASIWARAGLIIFAQTTAVTLTFTYQEHALGTLFYIPWLWICWIRLRDSYRYLVSFGVLLGLSFNNHYPQLILIYMLTLSVAALASLSELREKILVRVNELRRASLKVWMLGISGFLLSASPVIYSYANYHSRLESPFRLQKDGISSVNYEEYQIINTALSKLHPANLKLYAHYEPGKSVMQTALDESLTFMGPTTAFIVFCLVFLKLPLKRFHLFMLLTLALYSLGTYTDAPRLFWNIIPGITLFRQWIFFLVFLNLQLLYLTFVVGEAFVHWRLKTKADIIIACVGLVGFSILLVFRWVGWECGIPAAILFCLKFGLPEKKKHWVRTTFYTWLIAGCVWEAMGYLTHLRGFVNRWTASHLYGSSVTEKGAAALGALKGTYREFVALPKDVNTEDYWRMNERGDVLFATVDGEMNPVSSERLTLIDEAIRIEIDPKYRFLVFPQLNDGGWSFKSDGFLPIQNKLLKGTGNWIKIPSGAEQITITRKKSLWHYLSVFMWIPLGLMFIDFLLKTNICTSLIYRARRWVPQDTLPDPLEA